MIKKRFMITLLAVILLFTSISFSVQAVPSNSSMSTATYLSSQIGDEFTISGLSAGQSQWFYINATAGQWLYAAIYSLPSTCDWDLRIYNSSGTEIANSKRGKGIADYKGITAPSSGYYYFEVRAFAVDSTYSSCKFKIVCSGGTNYSAATTNYDRIDAKDYMILYWQTPNTPTYPDFSTFEEIPEIGDCANFASQILRYGGMSMITGNRDSPSSWFISANFNASPEEYSATWAGAHQFTTHWGTNSLGSGTMRAYECKYYLGQDLLENFSTITANLKVGDIIQHTNDAYTGRTHVQTVYNVTSNDIIVAEHTPNSRTNSLKLYAQQNPTKMIVIIRVKDGN